MKYFKTRTKPTVARRLYITKHLHFIVLWRYQRSTLGVAGEREGEL